MVIEGRHEIDRVPPERVFEALSDPALLARAVPGCRELVDRGDGVYELTIDAGVGSVRGRYSGEVRIGERRPNELYEAQLQASGTPGSVQAKMRAELAAQNGGTVIAYTMDATLSGPIAGVGQRVLSGASKKNAKMFLDALERELAAPPDTVPPSPSQPADPAKPAAAATAAAPALAATAAGRGDSSAAAEPRVHAGGAASRSSSDDGFQRGLIFGFALSAATFALAALLERTRR